MRRQDELYRKLKAYVKKEDIHEYNNTLTEYSMLLMNLAYKEGWNRCVEEAKRTGSLWEQIDTNKAG